MAPKTLDPETPKAKLDACPNCGGALPHLVSEHRARPVGDRTAVETYHIFECADCHHQHEEYDHEASNVVGPTMTRVLTPEPALREV